MLVYYFVPFIVSNRYLLFWVSNGHNSVTVQNLTYVYMNFFHHKDLGNHLLQLWPKVVKHPVCTLYIRIYVHSFIHTYIRTYIHTYIHINAYTHTYIHTYLHKNIHVYIRTHIHTHTVQCTVHKQYHYVVMQHAKQYKILVEKFEESCWCARMNTGIYIRI